MTTPRSSEVASPRVVTYVNAEQAPKVPNVGADPLRQWGRPPVLASRVTVGIGRPTSDPTQRSHRGKWRRHADTWGSSQHGKPQAVGGRILPTGRPRGTGRAAWGDGQVRSTDETG